jgi:ankyrin repeat protein
MAIPQKYPQLEFVLAEDGDNELLLEAILVRGEFQKLKIKLDIESSNSTFRAACILFLVAKFRAASIAQGVGEINFQVKRKTGTWLATLGPAMQEAKRRPQWVKDLRSQMGVVFFEAKRGSTHNGKLGKSTPNATYFCNLLPLSSLKISTAPRRENNSGPFLSTVLEGSALIDYAKKLEAKFAKWKVKTVEELSRGNGERSIQEASGAMERRPGPAKADDKHAADGLAKVRRSATGAQPWKTPGESIRLHKLKFEYLKLIRAGMEPEAIALVEANSILCATKLPPTGDCALITAITYKRSRVTKYLLGRTDVDINRRNEHGVTALLKAASINNFNLIKMLVEVKKADYKTVNDMGANVIYEAAFAAGHDAYFIIKYFHEECKIPCDQQISDGFYPLSQAIWRKCDERTIKYLIEHTGDLNAEDFYGETPFFKAVKYGYFEAVNLLIDLGGDNLRRKETPSGRLTDRANELFCAVSTGDLRRVKQLLADGNDDVDEAEAEFGRSPLHEAVESGHLQIVKELIDRGANVFVQNNHGRIPRDFLPSNRNPVSEQIEDVLVAAEEKWIETEWNKLAGGGRSAGF